MDTPGTDTPGSDTPGSTGETGPGAPDRPLNQDAEPPADGSPSGGHKTVSPDEPAPSHEGGDRPTPDRAPEDEAARVMRGAPGSPQEGVRPGQPDQASRQGYGRQRDVPQDGPPADVRDDQNIAGDKDFELQPPSP
jgi:hypothetical protein